MKHGMSGRGMKEYGSNIAHGTIAQMFAVVSGVILTLAGIAAVVVNADFSTGAGIVTDNLLFMDVNGWSGLLMLVSGIVLLVASRTVSLAKRVSLVVGVVYLALTVWSLFDSSILGMLPVNDPTAIFYAAIGVLGVTAGVGPDRNVTS
jgi:hypothetical protein